MQKKVVCITPGPNVIISIPNTFLGNSFPTCKNVHFISTIQNYNHVLYRLRDSLNRVFSSCVIASCPYTTFWQISKSINGIGDCPGYASGGGTIFNRKHYIDSYENILNKFTDVYDEFCKINKIFGWQDFMFQYIMMLGGYEIIQNHDLCELWEVPNFEGFEILTGCKEPDLVKL